jgi:hypothetical protein
MACLPTGHLLFILTLSLIPYPEVIFFAAAAGPSISGIIAVQAEKKIKNAMQVLTKAGIGYQELISHWSCLKSCIGERKARPLL